MKIRKLLNESITFGPAFDTIDDKSNFKDISSIAEFAQRIFYYRHVKNKTFFNKHLIEMGKNGTWLKIDMDGVDDYDKPTGTINVYPNGAVSEHFRNDFKDALYATIDELKKFVTVGKISVEGEFYDDRKRKPFKKEQPVTDIGVIRIPILKNDVKYDAPPELNVANANARSIITFLGFDNDDYSGGIKNADIPKYLMKLRNISSKTISDQARPESENDRKMGIGKDENGNSTITPKSMRVVDMGLSTSQITQYISRLIQIMEYCVKNKLDFSFG